MGCGGNRGSFLSDDPYLTPVHSDLRVFLLLQWFILLALLVVVCVLFLVRLEMTGAPGPASAVSGAHISSCLLGIGTRIGIGIRKRG